LRSQGSQTSKPVGVAAVAGFLQINIDVLFNMRVMCVLRAFLALNLKLGVFQHAENT
jgi:hypothetical protein